MRLAKDDLLKPEILGQLLTKEVLACEAPWPSNTDEAVQSFYRALVARLCREQKLLERSEWDHYGSGYASFIDIWLYRPDDEFRIKPGFGGANEYNGLAVLVSRQVPFFCFGEGEKNWDPRGGSSYCLNRECVDRIGHPAVASLIPSVERLLTGEGLTRLSREDMGPLLPSEFEIETNLGGPPYRLFDALFNWMD